MFQEQPYPMALFIDDEELEHLADSCTVIPMTMLERRARVFNADHCSRHLPDLEDRSWSATLLNRELELYAGGLKG